MKKIIAFCLFACLAISGFAQNDQVFMFSYFVDNGQDGLHLATSEDGYTWRALNDNQSFMKPAVGVDKLMRDPSVIKGGDGEYHMVWTVSWNERGIGYAHTKDFKHWSEQTYIPVMEHEAEARNAWAPEIFYDADSALYMIYWATTIPGRFPITENNGDDKYNHRLYYVTTKDFKTFSKTKLLYDQCFNVIDAVIVKINGMYTMFLKDETKNPPQKNIRIATSKALTCVYSKPSEKITVDWVEGPTVTKIGNDWVVYFDQYTRHKMGAVRSADLQHWTDISDEVHFPEGTRHGTVFKVPRSILENLGK